MEELKPCPFCGGEARIQTFHFRYRVGCGTNGCIAGRFNRAFDTPEKAAAAWNRRAERTCRMVDDCSTHDTCVVNHEMSNGNVMSMEFGYRQCSGCGAYVFDCPTVRYCPSCGARVVG